MDSDQMNRLNDVYRKWNRNPGANWNKPDSNSFDTAGRKSWEDKFGKQLRPRPVRPTTTERKKRPKNKTTRDEAAILPPPEFRLSLPILPVIPQRPVMGKGCTTCCPNSYESFFTMERPKIAVSNILNLDSFIKDNIFRRSFSHIAYSYSREMKYTLSDVSKDLMLSRDRVKNAVLACALKEKDSKNNQTVPCKDEIDEAVIDLTSQEKQAAGIFSGMQSIVYKWLLRFSAWVLFKLFGHLLANIQVQEHQISMIKEAEKEGIPVIFLPLHKSHLDYILLTFVLVLKDIQIPYIAAGDNLSGIPVFSWLMRHLGAFFIKRKLDRQTGADLLYGTLLQSYVEELLQQGQFIEIFIEGTRSRTGHGLLPKTGLLSTIVKPVIEGTVQDVYIVPVSISYEKIIEGSYSSQLLGKPKRPESFCEAMRGVYKTLTTNLGNVRVDMSQPYSLKEFLQSAQNIPSLASLASSPEEQSAPHSLSSDTRNSSEISLSALDDQYYPLAKCLGTHVIYDCVNCTSLMTTHLVAFLLLTIHREGVSIKKLVESVKWLKGEVTQRGRDLGFSGTPESAAYRGIKYLGENVVLYEEKEEENKDSVMFVKPNLAMQNALDLSFYSNQVISLFQLESVIAIAISSEMNCGNHLTEKVISRKKVITQAMALCQFLSRELILVAPCVDLKSELQDVLESFVSKGILSSGERGNALSMSDRKWAGGIASSASWDDEGEMWDDDIEYDIEYKVDGSLVSSEQLNFFCSVLSPRIESYWLAAGSLLRLIEEEMTEADFLKSLHENAKERVESGVTIYSETCSLEPLKNAIKVFKDQGIILESSDSKKLLQLSSGYSTKEELFTVVQCLASFHF